MSLDPNRPKDASIFKHLDEKPMAGCIHFPYKGYDVSLTTVRHSEVIVFAGRESNHACYTVHGASAEDLLEAFKWVDENPHPDLKVA